MKIVKCPSSEDIVTYSTISKVNSFFISVYTDDYTGGEEILIFNNVLLISDVLKDYSLTGH